ncbi:hypothetical protein KM043_003598 [Ampulex compressa]|nr:hypothetical protein KM043_003598 [Ampulex compressa]
MEARSLWAIWLDQTARQSKRKSSVDLKHFPGAFRAAMIIPGINPRFHGSNRLTIGRKPEAHKQSRDKRSLSSPTQPFYQTPCSESTIDASQEENRSPNRQGSSLAKRRGRIFGDFGGHGVDFFNYTSFRGGTCRDLKAGRASKRLMKRGRQRRLRGRNNEGHGTHLLPE